MPIFTVDLTITTESIVALVGLVITIVIATIGGIYAIVTNTKKYELSECYRKELLDWYTKTVQVMVALIHHIRSSVLTQADCKAKKTELLSQLSAQIETGRFYFPNIVKKDGYGEEKPSAYQGRRQLVLEYLIHFYRVASTEECKNGIATLKNMERRFTSTLFDIINPKMQNKLHSKYTGIPLPEGKTIDDFIREDPENALVFSSDKL